MIVNLTPHPMHIYPLGTPDRIEPGTVDAIRVIEPANQFGPARLGSMVVGQDDLGIGVPVENVVFGPDNGPVGLPAPVDGTWYLVSLVVGLAASDRTDLLVPHDYVRDMNGCIVGSRKLARPHRS